MNGERFVKTPHFMLFYYTFLPKYKAEMTTLYGLLTHYYNVEEGYAWPNVDTLAFHYGKTAKTTGEHLDVLEEYGLLRTHMDGAKKLFVPVDPVSSLEELFERYPEAEREYKRRLAGRDAERRRSADNMARMRERRRSESVTVNFTGTLQ
ncbi:hypothetical protein C0R09_18700 [Brevibacillus laterosporus]|uniref:helix-turn-helix domain-containing protein n=1 Tax=Brevibacillus laterosporus TaxID=1465 RepID=UPI000C7945AB|nr:helix-turn-helix domain-containing protein [Brevibacillus laterosporus]AUM66384.1 hypothetical protein C0R09_18700 [Brevibacillus laterosporus]